MPGSLDTVLKRFDQPDEVREVEGGRLELVTIGGQTLGRATYQPGWKWSAPGVLDHTAKTTPEPFIPPFPGPRPVASALPPEA